MKVSQYLGDGAFVYADLDRGVLRLTTEDGTKVVNEVVLEPDVFLALLQFVDTSWPALAAATDRARNRQPATIDDILRRGDERQATLESALADVKAAGDQVALLQRAMGVMAKDLERGE
jgi:hypothetical protein